jgi:sugar lactone lactonase YvrE
VIANSFQGRPLNRPNDVVVKSDGSIYFTDPNGNFVPNQWDLAFAGVYRVTDGAETFRTEEEEADSRLRYPPTQFPNEGWHRVLPLSTA